MCFAPFKKFYRQMRNPKFSAASDVYASMFFCDFINFFIVVFGYKDFGPVVRIDLSISFFYLIDGYYFILHTLSFLSEIWLCTREETCTFNFSIADRRKVFIVWISCFELLISCSKQFVLNYFHRL